MSSVFETSLDVAEEIYSRIQNDFDNLTEDSFNDELYDVLHEELDDKINRMYQSEVDQLLAQVGFDYAMETYIDEFGAIDSGVTSKTLLLVCIKNLLHEKLSFEHFIEFTKGNMIF
jgi:hypothetical protein